MITLVILLVLMMCREIGKEKAKVEYSSFFTPPEDRDKAVIASYIGYHNRTDGCNAAWDKLSKVSIE